MSSKQKADYQQMLQAFEEVVTALPAKARLVQAISTVRAVTSRAFGLLNDIRQYILDRPELLGGEESPFVKEIDKLIDWRPAPKKEKEGGKK